MWKEMQGSQLIRAVGQRDHEPGAPAGEQTHSCGAIWERYASVTAAQGSQSKTALSPPAAPEPFRFGMQNQQNGVGTLRCAQH